MRILFIAITYSIHTVRWLSQIKDKDWEIYLYPSNMIDRTHQDLCGITIFNPFIGKIIYCNKNIINYIKLRINNCIIIKFFIKRVRKIVIKINPNYYINRLVRIIKKIKPDIIHSMETQSAGYLTLGVKKKYKGKFPKWLHTNWGSDIKLFGQLVEHKNRIKDVLANCNYYSCECYRDLVLARKFDFKGKAMEVFPNTGGFDLEKIKYLRFQGKTSKRKRIMIKGYQGWTGRCLVGLRALELCSELLKEYEILIYNVVTEDVKIKIELLKNNYNLKIKVIPNNTIHEEILKYHGSSRISIGLSISDAISTSFLEALVMGSFPIQSWTSCADEWIKDGESGFLVPPEDPDIIAKALKKALTNDELVDRASEINYKIAKEKLDYDILKQKSIDIYNSIYNDKKY